MRLLVSLCLAAMAVPAAPVSADPSSCVDGGRKQRAHETGRKQGSSFAEAAWAAAERDCRQRARVERSVRDALARTTTPPEANETVRCRGTGFEAGANDVLARIAAACTGK